MAELEEKFVELGKSYGYSEGALFEYVEKRMTEAQEREDRAQSRELEKMRMELEKLAMEKQPRESARAQELRLEDTEEDGRSSADASSRSVKRAQKVIEIPKYDGKQAVTTFIELFEDIVRQNMYDVDEWLLRLRVSLAGTALEGCCEGCEKYEDAKRELLTAHGTTPAKVWKLVLSMTQKQEESFHQYVGRVGRAASQWITLSMNKLEKKEDDTSRWRDEFTLSSDGRKVMECLVKQVVIESCAPDLHAFIIERKPYEMTIEFQVTGMSYQSAHGKRVPLDRKVPLTKSYVPPRPTSQCLAVSVRDSKKRLADMNEEQRRDHIMEQRVCWNCLKPGHRAGKCYSKPACSKCPRKHHTLLHGVEFGAREIGSYSCGVAKHMRLMTGVAEVGGAKKAKVRVFIDPGSQASFVSQALVRAIHPKFVDEQAVRIKGFGSDPTTERMQRFTVSVTGKSGTIPMDVWQRASLDVVCESVSPAEVESWQQRGFSLSDQPGHGTPKEVHLLIGADYCNEFLVEKKVVDENVVWSTELGWMLSGPSPSVNSEPQVSVSCVAAQVEQLWKLDEVPPATKNAPDFPLRKTEDGYEVGLLWKSEQRPADNYAKPWHRRSH